MSEKVEVRNKDKEQPFCREIYTSKLAKLICTVIYLNKTVNHKNTVDISTVTLYVVNDKINICGLSQYISIPQVFTLHSYPFCGIKGVYMYWALRHNKSYAQLS